MKTQTSAIGATPPALDKLAYSLDEFAAAVSLHKNTIRAAIDAGDLVPSYVGTKPLIARTEGERWLRSLPAERPTR